MQIHDRRLPLGAFTRAQVLKLNGFLTSQGLKERTPSARHTLVVRSFTSATALALTWCLRLHKCVTAHCLLLPCGTGHAAGRAASC